MRILPRKDDDPSVKALAWARIILGVLVIAAGLLTQFNVTVNQSIDKRPITETKLVQVSSPAKVEKPGEVTVENCYSFAEHHGDWTFATMLDTFGTPTKEGDADPDWPQLSYHVKGKDTYVFCTVDFQGYGDTDTEIESVDLDLFVDFG